MLPVLFFGLARAGELSVQTTFMPDECVRRSANGDKLTMHYTVSIGLNRLLFISFTKNSFVVREL